MTGKVYLVGAGPGDPGLITVRGRELIEQADAILHDALIGNELLEFAGPNCERIYVGKRSGAHSFSQEEINRRLVELAQEGKKVVRLKGGDPYVFGRGGEEGLACREANVEVEIVPGVSSAFAVPASAGIPVLFREKAASVLVLHGRMEAQTSKPAAKSDENEEQAAPPEREDAGEDSGGEEDGKKHRGGVVIKRHKRRDKKNLRVVPSSTTIARLCIEQREGNSEEDDNEAGALQIDWTAALASAQTIVILMGLGRMDEIREGLLDAGCPPERPVAVIQKGTTANQRSIRSTVERFPEATREAKLETPAVIVVGDTVALAEQLNFFESRPLFGWRIALLDPSGECSNLVSGLSAAGAQPITLPCARSAPLAGSPEELEALRAEFKKATHLIVSRAELVEPMLSSLRISGFSPPAVLAGPRLLASDQRTADSLEAFGFQSSVLDENMASPAFAHAFGGDIAGSRVIVMEQENDWYELADDLEEAGATILNLPIYQAEVDEDALIRLADHLENDELQGVVFASEFVVQALLNRWGFDRLAKLLRGTAVVAWGEKTAALLETAQIDHDLIDSDVDGDALAERLGSFRQDIEYLSTQVPKMTIDS